MPNRRNCSYCAFVSMGRIDGQVSKFKFVKKYALLLLVSFDEMPSHFCLLCGIGYLLL